MSIDRLSTVSSSKCIKRFKDEFSFVNEQFQCDVKNDILPTKCNSKRTVDMFVGNINIVVKLKKTE